MDDLLISLLGGVVLVELGVMIVAPFIYRGEPFKWARTTAASLLVGGLAIVVLLGLLAQDWGNLLVCSVGVVGFTLVYYVLALVRARLLSARLAALYARDQEEYAHQE